MKIGFNQLLNFAQIFGIFTEVIFVKLLLQIRQSGRQFSLHVNDVLHLRGQMVDFPAVDFLHNVLLVGQFIDCGPRVFAGPDVRVSEEMIVSGFPSMPEMEKIENISF